MSQSIPQNCFEESIEGGKLARLEEIGRCIIQPKIKPNPLSMLVYDGENIKIYDIRIRNLIICSIPKISITNEVIIDIDFINDNFILILCPTKLIKYTIKERAVIILAELSRLFSSIQVNHYNPSLCYLKAKDTSEIYNLEEHSTIFLFDEMIQIFVQFFKDTDYIISFTITNELQIINLINHVTISSQLLEIETDDSYPLLVFNSSNMNQFLIVIKSVIIHYIMKKEEHMEEEEGRYIYNENNNNNNGKNEYIKISENEPKPNENIKFCCLSYRGDYCACVYENEPFRVYIYNSEFNKEIMIKDIEKEGEKIEIKNIFWSLNHNILFILDNTGELYKIQNYFYYESPGIMFPPGYIIVPKNEYYIEAEDEFDFRDDESRNYIRRDVITITSRENEDHREIQKYFMPIIKLHEIAIIDSYLDDITPISNEEGEKLVRDSLIFSSKSY